MKTRQKSSPLPMTAGGDILIRSKFHSCYAGFASVNFWHGSSHLQSAIERCYEFYLQSILSPVRSELVQALFAINEVLIRATKAGGMVRTLVAFVVQGGQKQLPWAMRAHRNGLADELQRLQEFLTAVRILLIQLSALTFEHRSSAAR